MLEVQARWNYYKVVWVSVLLNYFFLFCMLDLYLCAVFCTKAVVLPWIEIIFNNRFDEICKAPCKPQLQNVQSVNFRKKLFCAYSIDSIFILKSWTPLCVSGFFVNLVLLLKHSVMGRKIIPGSFDTSLFHE